MPNLTTQTTKISVIFTNRNIDTLKGYLNSSTFKDYLNNNCKFYAMILHDKDITEDSQLKTPHIHLVMHTLVKRRLSTWVNDLSDFLHLDKVLISISPIKDMVSNVRYLIHLDSKDKYPYERTAIITSDNDILNDYLDSESTEITYDTLVHILTTSEYHWQVIQRLGLSKYNYYYKTINVLCSSLKIFLK